MDTLSERWYQRATQVILHTLPTRAHRRYTGAESIRHFKRVAEAVKDRTGSEDLAQAGFLHGVPADLVLDLRARLALSEAAAIALVDRERLRETDPRLFVEHANRDFEAAVREYFLSRTRSGASAVLLVLEQLDHLDPSTIGRGWLSSFYADPTKAGDPPPLPPAHEGRGSIESHLVFVDAIVAAVAKHFGFWLEHRFLRDLVALHRRRTDITAASRFIAAHHAEHVEFAVNSINSIITPRDPNAFSTKWDWHHLARCVAALGDNYKLWGCRLGQCGFITTMADADQSAYSILGRLHAQPSHNPAFRDHLSHARPSGYRALHTAIDVPSPKGVTRLDVHVVREINDTRRARDRMRDVARQSYAVQHAVGQPTLMVVYTPAHLQQHLLSGSTVLDFAYTLCTRWVGFARMAKVNGMRMQLKDELRHGDLVELSVAPEPSFLVRGWESWLKHIPESHDDGGQSGNDNGDERTARARERYRKQVQRHYVKAVVPAIIKSGRDLIRTRVRDLHLVSAPDQLVDSLLAAAIALGRNRGVFAKASTSRPWALTTKGWLRQLGLYALALDPGTAKLDVPGQLRLDGKRVDQVMACLADVTHTVPDIVLPIELRAQVDDVVHCMVCTPTFLHDSLVGVLDDGLLHVHTAECYKASAGFALVASRRLSLRQYIQVDASDRLGLLADISAVLHARSIDVLEFMALRHGPAWAAIRIEVDCPSGYVIDAVLDELRKVRGVSRVFGPDEPPNAQIEQGLPPRRNGQLVRFGTNPVAVGTPASEEQFYGRGSELETFRELCRGALNSQADNGLSIFLKAPLQFGKTSFLLKALRELRAQPERNTVAVYLEARLDESWPMCERRIVRELSQRVRELQAGGTPLLSLWDDKETLPDVLDHIRSRSSLNVVIVIDEVARLLDATANAGQDACDGLLAAATACSGTRRVVLAWSGPTTALHFLDHKVQTLLDNKSVPLTLNPLRGDDIRHLISASKQHGSVTDGRVHENVVARVLELTGGDPLWVSSLAHAMWSAPLTKGIAVQRARFSDTNCVEDALRELIQRDSCFRVRLRFLESPQGQRFEAPVHRILAGLATSSTFSQHHADDTGPADGSFVQNVYDLLEMSGLVVQQSGGYRLAAPMLGVWIREKALVQWSQRQPSSVLSAVHMS